MTTQPAARCALVNGSLVKCIIPHALDLSKYICNLHPKGLTGAPAFWAHRSKKAHIRADLERGTYSDDKGITVARYAEKWYELNMPGKSTAADKLEAYYLLQNP